MQSEIIQFFENQGIIPLKIQKFNRLLENEILKFENEVFKTLDIVETNINIGKEAIEINCKSIVILKQITLFYNIK